MTNYCFGGEECVRAGEGGGEDGNEDGRKWNQGCNLKHLWSKDRVEGRVQQQSRAASAGRTRGGG